MEEELLRDPRVRDLKPGDFIIADTVEPTVVDYVIEVTDLVDPDHFAGLEVRLTVVNLDSGIIHVGVYASAGFTWGDVWRPR